jgi:hypothetical protein
LLMGAYEYSAAVDMWSVGKFLLVQKLWLFRYHTHKFGF